MIYFCLLFYELLLSLLLLMNQSIFSSRKIIGNYQKRGVKTVWIFLGTDGNSNFYVLKGDYVVKGRYILSYYIPLLQAGRCPILGFIVPPQGIGVAGADKLYTLFGPAPPKREGSYVTRSVSPSVTEFSYFPPLDLSDFLHRVSLL